MHCIGGVVLGALILASASAGTDFGIRVPGASPSFVRAATSSIRSTMPSSGGLSLSTAAALGAHWGRVTSTYRSPEHNRDVGGVPNSYHLLGRAIDIARRPGVDHAMIATSFRNAGYRLVESLDEGDHTHLAFSFGGSPSPSFHPLPKRSPESSGWRVVYAPGSR